MPIGKVSAECSQVEWQIEWRIEDFFSFEDGPYDSSLFSVAGTQRYLAVYPNGRARGGNYVSLMLLNVKSTDTGCDIGVKRADGSVEWLCSGAPRCRLGFGAIEFLRRSLLLQRKSEWAPSNAVTFAFALRTKAGLEPSSSVDALSRSLADLFVSQRGSDATLRVKGEEFPVHRAILIARSPVFAAMFEADMREKSTGVVEIPDCDPGAFRTFLEYLYSGRIENFSGSDAMEVYRIADKYDVGDLKSYCCTSIARDLSVENMLDTVVFGDTFSESVALKAQAFFEENFWQIVCSAKWDDFFSEHATLVNQLLRGMAKEMTA